jgi:hypothetical protein
LPFYQDFNYTLNPDAVEMVGIARNAKTGELHWPSVLHR